MTGLRCQIDFYVPDAEANGRRPAPSAVVVANLTSPASQSVTAKNATEPADAVVMFVAVLARSGVVRCWTMPTDLEELLIKARTNTVFSAIRKASLFLQAIVSASAANGGWYRRIEPK